jgi:hypothetical protein
MDELARLVGHRFQSLSRREYDWVFRFDHDASLRVECLWRLIQSSRIQFTSEDDGHQFGLPAPVDVTAEVRSRLASAIVQGVELRQGILDLELHFNTGGILQILPTSAGYEAWELSLKDRLVIALGGGELAIF